MNMARNCRALVRQFLVSGSNPCAALVHHYHKLSCNSIHTLLLGLTSIPTISSSPTTIASTSKPFSNFFCAPNLHLLQHRRLVSSPPDRLLVKVIVTKDDYDLEVKRIQDESLPAILCFATYSEHYSKWVSEFLENELSERFSLVPIYYFILDPKEDDYETTLKSLNISSTPTFHFFKNGKKVDELASERFEFYQYAADLEKILEKLYK